MTPTELKAEMERIWQSRGVRNPIHFLRWRVANKSDTHWVQENLKLISTSGNIAIARKPKRVK